MNDSNKKQAGIGEFGRMLGVGHSAIHSAIKSGRIPPSMIGTRVYKGRVVAFIADVEAAKTAFLENTHPTRRQDGARISAGKKAANAEAHGDTMAAERHRAMLNNATCDDTIPTITESRAIVEAYRAKIMRLAYERESGKLVDANEFRIKFTSMVTTARTRLLGVPSKAKGRIPHLTVDEIGVLSDLIREALEDIAGASGHTPATTTEEER